MKSPEEYVDEIAEALYMGEAPDLWNMMAKVLIVRALIAFKDERLDEAVSICNRNCSWTSMNEIQALKSQP